MNSSIRIAIVGGGPGGLMLARLLQVRGIAATVYERDAHAGDRPQGGTLDLHADSGQRALRAAGLGEGFLRIARYEDQETRLFDRAGALLFEETDAAGHDRPEVDRSALRELLLGALRPGCVQWGRRLAALAPQGEAWRLDLEDGGSAVFDLVVGADGAWSRVRPLLSAATPAFTGVSFVEGGLDEVDTAHPALARLVGRGKTFALGERQALIAQRNANAHVRVYAALNVGPAGPADAGLDACTPAALRASVLARFAGWAPPLRALVERCPDPLVLRPLVALPVGHAWKNRPGLTLLGDAAHVMSPFSGEGVNNALWDALALADELGAGGDWRAAVQRYETAMFARAAVSATGAAQGLESVMGADALADALAHFRAHAAAQIR